MLGNGTKFGIVSADDEQDRTRDGDETVPERLLGSGASKPETRRQTRRRVAKPIAPHCGLGGQPSEQGVGKPLVDERLDAHVFEVVGQPLVGVPS